MTPAERYAADIAHYRLIADEGQRAAIQYLQQFYDDFTRAEQHQKKWLQLAKQRLNLAKNSPVIGLYLWGGVGAGKTYLMDLLYESIPSEKKLRMHFHVFMHHVHHQLKTLQGITDPLKQAAKQFKQQADIIFFDEFFISDIGDAMILGGLLKALFEQGVSLVTTSNIKPDDLYQDGLQRDLFLPAIELLKKNTTAYHLIVNEDYRLRTLTHAGVFYYPLNEISAVQMRDAYKRVAHGVDEIGKTLLIEGREILTRHHARDVVWFDFNVLCTIPRSQADYLEIASSYQTVLISGVPQIKASDTTAVTYFICLIDVFYDAKVKLILSCEVALPQIYPEGEKLFEFQRTLSRLQEMQTTEYLSLSKIKETKAFQPRYDAIE